jgi:hypothetical protein
LIYYLFYLSKDNTIELLKIADVFVENEMRLSRLLDKNPEIARGMYGLISKEARKSAMS